MNRILKLKGIALVFVLLENLIFAQTVSVNNQNAVAQSNVSGLRPQTHVGGQETHGGDPVQASFIQMGRYAVQHLRRLRTATRFSNIDPNILSETVESRNTPVPVNYAIRCGHLTDAPACFNSATQEIVFNSGKWSSYSESQQLQLAVHEFLRRAGYSREEDSYQISSELIRLVPPARISSREHDFCPTNQPRCVFTRNLQPSQLGDHDLKIEFIENQTVNVQIDRSHLICRSRGLTNGQGAGTRIVSIGSANDSLSTIVTGTSGQPRSERGGMVWGVGISCAEVDCYGWRRQRFVIDDFHEATSARVPAFVSFVSGNFDFMYWTHFSRVVKRLSFVSYFNMANQRLPSDIAYAQYCDGTDLSSAEGVIQLRIEIINQ